MSKWEQTGLPCPKCSSSDAFAIDNEGVGHCFSCGYHDRAEIDEELPPKESNMTQQKTVKGFKEHRGIGIHSFRKYNVMTSFIGDEPYQVGFIYPLQNGKKAVKDHPLKIRGFNEKTFKTRNFNNEVRGLFGSDVFDKGSRETITIVEGEYDALAAWQMLNDVSAVVSVQSATTAKRDCKDNYEYINSFKRIVFCFDRDEPGQKAMDDCIPMFDYNKVYRLQLEKFKDPNDYLKNDCTKEFCTLWNNVKKHVPDEILHSFKDVLGTLSEQGDDQIGTYPFQCLNNALYGLHRGEVVVVKGGSGIGKTEIFRAMEHHLLKTTKCNIGIIHLEESNADTIKGIATYELKQPVFISELNISNEEIFNAFKQAVGNREDRVYLHKSFDNDSSDSILNNIRFLGSACDCDFIFLDHISWLAVGQDNEHAKLAELSQKLKLLAMELNVCIIEISHVNDDGKVAGSRNIKKVANTVIHIERNNEDEDVTKRNQLTLTVEKGRRQGSRTGYAGSVSMNLETYNLEEVVF